MSIIKNTPHYLKHSQSTFTTVLNKTIEAIIDPASLGIYLYLASKPNDWQISETNLRNRFNKGGDFIRARLADLKRIGLLKSLAIKDDKGRVTHWETVLYNEVQEFEDRDLTCETHIVENPPSGFHTHVEDPYITNKRLLKIKEDIKIKDLKHTPLPLKGKSERFQEFWNLYPVKKARKACETKWQQRNLDEKSDLIIEKLFEQVNDDDSWKRGYAPHPLTYINQDRWEDDISQPVKSSSRSSSFDEYQKNQRKQGETYDQHGNTYDPFR